MESIEHYKQKLITIQDNCMQLTLETEIKELFKGVVIMFLKNILLLYNKLLKKLPELRTSNSSEKISNLNTLLNSLESDGILFNINVNDVIIRAYTTYIYTKYRDEMLDWNTDNIKLINEQNIKDEVVETAKKENLVNNVADYFDIIPEIVLIINNLKETDVLKLLFILNNLNTIIDVYLVKKSQNIF
jgi:hypothetical protein